MHRDDRPRVYVDFLATDDEGNLLLDRYGTVRDLEQQGVTLKEGLLLACYSDDADDNGQPDELRVEGRVTYNAEEKCWVAVIDRNAIRHASELEKEAQEKT